MKSLGEIAICVLAVAILFFWLVIIEDIWCGMGPGARPGRLWRMAWTLVITLAMGISIVLVVRKL